MDARDGAVVEMVVLLKPEQLPPFASKLPLFFLTTRAQAWMRW